jgi:hypothetical protein
VRRPRTSSCAWRYPAFHAPLHVDCRGVQMIQVQCRGLPGCGVCRGYICEHEDSATERSPE